MMQIQRYLSGSVRTLERKLKMLLIRVVKKRIFFVSLPLLWKAHPNLHLCHRLICFLNTWTWPEHEQNQRWLMLLLQLRMSLTFSVSIVVFLNHFCPQISQMSDFSLPASAASTARVTQLSDRIQQRCTSRVSNELSKLFQWSLPQDVEKKHSALCMQQSHHTSMRLELFKTWTWNFRSRTVIRIWLKGLCTSWVIADVFFSLTLKSKS